MHARRLFGVLSSVVLCGCGGAVGANETTFDAGANASDDASNDDVTLSVDAPVACLSQFSTYDVTPGPTEIVLDLDGVAPAPIAFSATLRDPTTGTLVDVSSRTTLTLGRWWAEDVGDRMSAGGPREMTQEVDGPVGGSFAGDQFTPAIGFVGHVAHATALTSAHVSGLPCGDGKVDFDVVQLRSTAGREDVLLQGFGTSCGDPATPTTANLGRLRHRTSASGGARDVGVSIGADPALPFSLNVDLVIASVRAVSEGDVTKGCVANAAVDTNGDGIDDTFKAVPPGATVCFEVTPKQATVYLVCAAKPRHFEAFVDIIEGGGSTAERHAIVVHLPTIYCGQCF